LTHRVLLRHSGHDARTFLRLCLAQYDFYLEPVSLPVSTSVSGRG